jgi:hypothetical protein
VIFRRRFSRVIERQLDLFERENADLIRRCVLAERAYDGAERDEAEARYSEYLDLVEIGVDELAEMRDAYTATLDEDAAEAYEAAFARAVRKRLPRFALRL